jgi:hypothetical protein
MSDLVVTPLESLPAEPAGGCGPAVFLKREDLLPYGGGNKVRRLLAWIDELPAATPAAAIACPQTIAVLSYRGASTFLVLAELFRHGVFPCQSLLFWESNRPATPYVDQVRRRYVGQPGIAIVSGSVPALLARMGWTKWFGRGKVAVLGIGGAVSPRSQPYRVALDECVRQLGEHRRPDGRIWHMLPAGSGTMLAGLAQAIHEAGYRDHRLIGVLTGPPISRRMLRWKYRGQRNVVLVLRQRMDWAEYLAAAMHFHERSGVWLDPTHTIYVAQTLAHLPAKVGPQDVVICWVTCPRISPLGDSPASPCG